MKASSGKKKIPMNRGFLERIFAPPLEGEIKKALPDKLFFGLAFVALALPNLIFSGPNFFDTLHVMKWVFAMTPVALMAIIGGARLCAYGEAQTDFRLDTFGLLWLVMLAYVSIQPLWVDITSWSTYFKEWFFFVTLIGMYIFTFNQFHGRGYHKAILLAANINAALNVIFAELLIRKMNGCIPFIMNVPENYIGNTGQQEMFGLWMAMSLMNGLYLHVAGWENERAKYAKPLKLANLILVAINAWGLWNSTTRGGIASLMVGTTILALLVWRTQRDREMFRRMTHIAMAIIAMLIITLAAGTMFQFGRAADLISKTTDMVVNIKTIGGRKEIWQTSMIMVKDYALGGVGIGHYKWHFLEAQQKALHKYPDISWMFTYWAHSEYIQWFAEFGIFGIIFLLLVGVWWLWSFIIALLRKRTLSLESVWASSMLFLIWFDAIFSRPFHRIENVIWVAFAFAIVNREILPLCVRPPSAKITVFYRFFGAAICGSALAGLFFLGSGLRGDRYLWKAVRTQDAKLQLYRIIEARGRLMMRDEAEEQYAYHLIAVARATSKRDDWDKAIAQLYKAHKIRPKSKELIDLINLSRQHGHSDIFLELLPLVQRPQSAPVSQ